MINLQGSSRIVIITKNFAIKIPRCFVPADDSYYGKMFGFLQGWKANRSEYMVSKTEKTKKICKVIFSLLGSLIIVMKRAYPLTATQFMSINSNDYLVEHEHKIDSYGVVDGRIVIIDYGK